jgi:integrase
MASAPWFDENRGRWYMKYKPDPAGDWKRASLGKQPAPWSKSRPPKTPPQFIKDRAREFEEIEYRAKNNMAAPPKRAKGLDGYLADYVHAYEATHDAGSLKQLARHIKTLLAFAEKRGVKSLQGVNKAFCRDYLQERIKKVSASTLQTEKGYLGPIWTKALEDELVQANPWHLVDVPGKIIQPEPTFWSPEEVAAIAANCSKPWQSDLVMVLATTGIRISATLAMEWSWIDFGEGFLTIPKEHSKSGRAYKIALIETAREILERRAMTGNSPNLVFPNPRGAGVVPYDSARAAIERSIIKAKVKAGTPHDLRHTYGRWMALEGKPFSVIQAQLGHTTPAMTGRYTKISETEARKHVADMRFEQKPEPST